MSETPLVINAPARIEHVVYLHEVPDSSVDADKRPLVWTGATLAPENAPKQMHCTTKKQEKMTFPDFFFTRQEFFVSKQLREVLEAFDLGSVQFYDIELLSNDQKSTVSFAHNVMRISNLKNSLVPEKSVGVVDRAFRPGFYTNEYANGGGSVPTKPSEICLTPEALEGPDIWLEELLKNAAFVSPRLGKAIKDAGLGDCFDFKATTIA